MNIARERLRSRSPMIQYPPVLRLIYSWATLILKALTTLYFHPKSGSIHLLLYFPKNPIKAYLISKFQLHLAPFGLTYYIPNLNLTWYISFYAFSKPDCQILTSTDFFFFFIFSARATQGSQLILLLISIKVQRKRK